MNKKVKILIFCMVFVVGSSFGQNAINNFVFKHIKTTSTYFSNGFSNNKKIMPSLFVLTNTQNFKSPFIQALNLNKVAYLISKPIINKPIVVIAPNYYTQNLGFFCKKELQLEKAIKIPLKFRLGSVEQCDRLEGKVK
jgi:hypothetical protein